MRRAVWVVFLFGCAERATQPPRPEPPRSPPVASSCAALPAPRHVGCYQREAPPKPREQAIVKPEDAEDCSLSKEQINLVVRRHLLEIKCCYEAALEKDPHLSGGLVAGWTITPAGQVSRSWVAESTLASEAVIACIAERICDWEFPGRELPTTVGRYPFVFKT